MFLLVIQVAFGIAKKTESYRINSRMIYFFLLKKLITSRYFFLYLKTINLTIAEYKSMILAYVCVYMKNHFCEFQLFHNPCTECPCK